MIRKLSILSASIALLLWLNLGGCKGKFNSSPVTPELPTPTFSPPPTQGITRSPTPTQTLTPTSTPLLTVTATPTP